MNLKELITTEPITEQRPAPEPVKVPDKEEYKKRVLALPAEDQAFLEGYLFAKVTERTA